MQPSGRLDFLELLGELLRLFEGCLLLGEKLNQVVLGAEQADLVLFELGVEPGSRESGMVHAGLGRIEQLDEVGLGPGDGDAVLLAGYKRI